MKKDFEHILKKIKWNQMILFAIVVAAAIIPVMYMLFRPTSKEDIKNHTNSLSTDISEADYLIQNKNKATKIYFRAQFEDLSDNTSQNSGIVERKAYDPAIENERQKYLDLSEKISDDFYD